MRSCRRSTVASVVFVHQVPPIAFWFQHGSKHHITSRIWEWWILWISTCIDPYFVGFNGSIPVQSPRKPIGAVRGAHDGNLIKEQLEDGGIGGNTLWSTNSLTVCELENHHHLNQLFVWAMFNGYVEKYQRGRPLPSVIKRQRPDWAYGDCDNPLPRGMASRWSRWLAGVDGEMCWRCWCGCQQRIWRWMRFSAISPSASSYEMVWNMGWMKFEFGMVK